jgi:hypothetical protein
LVNATLGSGGGVGSDFGVKTELSEQEPGTASTKLVTHFDGKDNFPYTLKMGE